MPKGVYQNPKTKTWEFTHQGAVKPNGEYGQVHRRGFRTRREAEKERALSIARTERGPEIAASQVTTGDYLEKWLSDYVQVTHKTLEGYGGIIRRHMIPAFGSVRLQALTAQHIQDYYQLMLTGGKKLHGGTLSPRSVVHHHWVICKALRYAVSPLRLIPYNPADGISPPRAESKQVQTLTLSAAHELLEKLQDSALYIPTALALGTGMRESEILALRWTDIDILAGAIHLSQSVTYTPETGLQRKGTKTGRGRNITMPGFVVAILNEHKQLQDAQRAALGEEWEDHGLVCPRPDGRPDKNPTYFANRFRQRMLRLKIPITFHGLRHTHATLALEFNTHPKIVSERLGHSRISTTLDIYSKVLPSMQAAAAEQFDEAFRKR